MLGLPAPFVPHSASLGPTTSTRVLSTPPTGLDECLFFISLVSDPLAVGFSVSSGCARRRSVSTYAAILVLCFFIFLTVSLQEQKFYINESNLSFFSFMVHAYVCLIYEIFV